MSLVELFSGRLGEIRSDLQALVNAESPSDDIDLLLECADLLSEIGNRITGLEPHRITVKDRQLLLFSHTREPKVLVLAHYDTVWPAGTIERWPYSEKDGVATGPGVFDMKSGVLQALHALSAADHPEDIAVLCTPDEEIGSPYSRETIRSLAKSARAVLVLEPSRDGYVKIGRKGIAIYKVLITGKAAHAGLEPEKGINSLIETAHQVLAIEKIADFGRGTSVCPTVAKAGTVENVIPAEAFIEVDVRAKTQDELDRVDAEIKALVPVVTGATIEVTGGIRRVPFHPEMANELLAVAQRAAEKAGVGQVEGVEVGGVSDGNLTAALGIKTLDGLGPSGDHAHAEGEYVDIASIVDRAALVTTLINELTSE